MRTLRHASIAIAIATLALGAPSAHAMTFTTLYSFKHPCCGGPVGRLHFLGSNLYGTGAGDGKAGDHGQVFELINSGGTWTAASPLTFNGTDGSRPAAGLISDSLGFLFGTTREGDAYGYGNVFILSNLGGSWTHATLWSFGGSAGDGQNPTCDLIKDSSGNLYGTTQNGGAYGGGTVFELTENFSTWTETVLHNFGSGSDGSNPYGGLLMDSSGAFYGTTENGGGATGDGTVFELTNSGGVWKETVLYSFGSDNIQPQGILIRDSKGALYGTAFYGGTYGTGSVFKVFQSGGVWKAKVLHSFIGGLVNNDGNYPAGGLIRSSTGALYGTTTNGGEDKNWGAVYKLTQSGGVWNETVLYSFTGGSDGGAPWGQIILDKSGNLYGTASAGGAYGYGTVWEITP